MGAVVGIDLGTTNTVVAASRDSSVVALPDESGSTLIPSVVSFLPSGAVMVGNAASERRSVDARNTIYSIKRLIGRTWGSAEVERAIARFPFELREGPGRAVFVVVRGETYTLPEISAFVLRKAKSIAELELGEPVDRAVITVPANFNDLQRAATKVAGRVAGLEVLRIVDEPAAAALAFGCVRGNRECIAVYDLGGGTFDFTLLRSSEDVFEILATAGDTYLGGDDIDTAIASSIARRVGSPAAIDSRTQPETFERLRAAAEEIKLSLSTEIDARVRLRDYEIPDAGSLEFSMTRAELEELGRPIVERTFEVCRSVMSQAAIGTRDIHQVLLVGGTTRDRFVRQLAERFFERSVRSELDPREVVALGAARQAMALTQLRATASGIPIAPVPDNANPLNLPARQTESGIGVGMAAETAPQHEARDSAGQSGPSRQKTGSGLGNHDAIEAARVAAPPPLEPVSQPTPNTQTLGSRDGRTTGLGLGPTPHLAAGSQAVPGARLGGTPPRAGNSPPIDLPIVVPQKSASSHAASRTHTAHEPTSQHQTPAEVSSTGAAKLSPGASRLGSKREDLPEVVGARVVAHNPQSKASLSELGPATRGNRTTTPDLPPGFAAAVVGSRRIDESAAAGRADIGATATSAIADLPATIASAVISGTSPTVLGAAATSLGTARPHPTTLDLPATVMSGLTGPGSVIDESAVPRTGRAAASPLDIPSTIASAVVNARTQVSAGSTPRTTLATGAAVENWSPSAVSSGLARGNEGVGDEDASDNEPTVVRNSTFNPTPQDPESPSESDGTFSEPAQESDWDLLDIQHTPPHETSRLPEVPALAPLQPRLSEAEIRARYGNLPLIVGGKRVGAQDEPLGSQFAATDASERLPPPAEQRDSAHASLELDFAGPPQVAKPQAPSGALAEFSPNGQMGVSAGVKSGGTGPGPLSAEETTVTKRVQAPALAEKSTPFGRRVRPPVAGAYQELELEDIESGSGAARSVSAPPGQLPPRAQLRDEVTSRALPLHSSRPSARQNVSELELAVPDVPVRTSPFGAHATETSTTNQSNRQPAGPVPVSMPEAVALQTVPFGAHDAQASSANLANRQHAKAGFIAAAADDKPQRPLDLMSPAGPGVTGRSAQRTSDFAGAVGGAAFARTPAAPTRQPVDAMLIGMPNAVASRADEALISPPISSSPRGLASFRPALPLEVTPLSLCVETAGGYVDVLVTRNTPLPCERTREFATARDNQQTVVIRIAQGESRLFHENLLLGEVQLTGIPAQSRGQAKIAVTFGLDPDGILNVRALDVSSGMAASAELRLANSPSAPEFAGMTARPTGKPLQ